MTQFTEYASVGREMAALVLFSGGQDSTTCLGWALERFGRVETIGVDYGQRHQAELECRVRVREKMAQLKPQWGERLGDDHLLKLPVLGEIADCALTDERRIAFEASGLPNTFVPGRNLLFFTLAASLAYRRGLRVLVGGMCETDYSGYPDCRDNTLKSLQVTLDLGYIHYAIAEARPVGVAIGVVLDTLYNLVSILNDRIIHFFIADHHLAFVCFNFIFSTYNRK